MDYQGLCFILVHEPPTERNDQITREAFITRLARVLDNIMPWNILDTEKMMKVAKSNSKLACIVAPPTWPRIQGEHYINNDDAVVKMADPAKIARSVLFVNGHSNELEHRKAVMRMENGRSWMKVKRSRGSSPAAPHRWSTGINGSATRFYLYIKGWIYQDAATLPVRIRTCFQGPW